MHSLLEMRPRRFLCRRGTYLPRVAEGSFVLLAPRAVLVMIAVFIAMVAIFRYVSLASIVAVALFPLLAWLLRDYHQYAPVLAIMAITAILIVAKHHQNIRRLMAGNENKLGVKRV